MKCSSTLGVAGIMLVLSVLSAQTTLLYEDFNGTFPPPGWVASGGWHQRDSGSVPWTDNYTPYVALLDSPPGQGTDSLISRAINCEDYNYIVLRCSTRVRNTPNPHYSRLLGSVGGGPFEHEIQAYQGVNYTQYETFDISSWAGNQSEVRLCWRFGGDRQLISYWCVDNVSVIGDNSSPDIGVDSIFAPRDTVDSGAVVIPEVSVRNFKSEPVTDTFGVVMRIGIFYRDTTWVTETIPGDSAIRVSFRDWVAVQRGRHPVSVEIFFLGDIEPGYNLMYGYVFVRVRDVGPLIIVSPPDTVDSATVVQPQVEIKNFGNVDADSFRVHFRIGGTIFAPELVTELDSGATRTVSFGDLYFDTVGVYLARCSTYWYDDINPRNDTLSKRILVIGTNFRDVAALRILEPRAFEQESTQVVPRGIVQNRGERREDFKAGFLIERDSMTVYHDSVEMSLGAGEADTAWLSEWFAAPEGEYIATLYVRPGGMNPDNDTASLPFLVVGAGGIGAGENQPPSIQLVALPNPGRGNVKLSLPAPDTPTVQLYDAGGRLLAAYPCLGRRRLDLDVSGFSPGVYFVRAQDQSCRLVIE